MTGFGQPRFWGQCVLFLGSLGALASCAGLNLDLNPFYVGSTGTDEHVYAESTSLGPLFDDRIDGEIRETALHPFWRTVSNKDRKETQILFPLFQYREFDRRFDARLLWTLWFTSRRPLAGPSEWDFLLIPLLFASGGDDGEDSFGILPFYGHVQNFLGFSEIFWVLFPFYYRLQKHITTEETFHNITPFIGWIDGGPRDGSWRFLPFYGRWRYENKFEKISIFWPFFHYHRDRLDQPDPSTLVALWPLFKIDKSDRHDFRTYLWPFFRFHNEWVPERELSDGTVRPAQHFFHRDVLWPVYRHQKTRELERLRIFPFYSRYRSNRVDSNAYLIPIIWDRQERRQDWTKDTFDVVPLWHWEEKRFHDGRPLERSRRLWPLVSHRDRGNGDRELSVFPLLPLDATKFVRDLEANYGPLFRIYHDRRRANGDRKIDILFRLIQYRKHFDERRFSIPILYSTKADRHRRTHDFLFGLIRVGTGRGGVQLRLLFLPLLSAEEPES